MRIQSAVALPADVGGEGLADVEVRFGRLQAFQGARQDGCLHASLNEALLSWRKIGAFRVRAGREIIVDSRLKTDAGLSRAVLLGPVFAVLLHQRGRLVLHASAVSMAGGIVGFVGRSGSGKSTIAATLHARGSAMVTDDLLTSDVGPEGPLAYPGFAELRLWPGVIEALGEVPEGLSRVHPQREKRSYPILPTSPTEPLPLRRLYLLEEGPRSQMDDVNPQSAFVELIRHTYTASLLDMTQARVHFFQCARLAAQVPVRRLIVQRSLEALPALAALVEQDVAAGIH